LARGKKISKEGMGLLIFSGVIEEERGEERQGAKKISLKERPKREST